MAASPDDDPQQCGQVFQVRGVSLQQAPPHSTRFAIGLLVEVNGQDTLLVIGGAVTITHGDLYEKLEQSYGPSATINSLWAGELRIINDKTYISAGKIAEVNDTSQTLYSAGIKSDIDSLLDLAKDFVAPDIKVSHFSNEHQHLDPSISDRHDNLNTLSALMMYLTADPDFTLSEDQLFLQEFYREIDLAMQGYRNDGLLSEVQCYWILGVVRRMSHGKHNPGDVSNLLTVLRQLNRSLNLVASNPDQFVEINLLERREAS